MKKSILNLFTFISALLLTTLYGCQRDIVTPKTIAGKQAITISEAKSYFKQNVVNRPHPAASGHS